MTSMQVTMITGRDSQAPQRPTTSTRRRRRSAMRTVFGISPDTAGFELSCVIARASAVTVVHQPERELRIGHHQEQADELQDHERDDAPVDALDLDFLRRDALDVEQREAERRR